MGLSPIDYSGLLNIAVQAARLAGQKAMEQLSQVSYSLKNQTEIVTQADPLCQAIIIDCIRSRCPQHGILAEEGPSEGMLLQPPTDNSNVWWVIDPIDGTNNYAHGLMCFCVSIGVFQDGTPVAAVIYDPCTQSMWTAAKGVSTRCNGKSVSVSTDSISKLSSFGIDSHFDSTVEPAIHQMLRLTRARLLGSTALHQAYVAGGGLIGALTVSARLWDIAAGCLLVQQAGGIVATLDRKPVFPIDIANYKAERFRLLSTNAKSYEKIAEIFETMPDKSRLIR
jgi:myo-inositol-1(or 4)-monophosphatase